LMLWVEPCGLKLKRNWKGLFLVHAARICSVMQGGAGGLTRLKCEELPALPYHLLVL
jgi:hypothetical protein